MRKKILAFTAAFVLAPAVLFAGAAPVAAHGDPDHTSCAGGVVGVIESGALGPEFVSGPGRGPAGAVIKFLASDEDAPFDAPTAVFLAHDAYCDDV